MNSSICPYLGLKDDPGTVLNFPSEGNICHRAQSKPAITREYQTSVCLLAEHMHCPVYLGTEEGRLPVGLSVPRSQIIRQAPLLWITIPALLILAVILLGMLSPGIFSAAQSLAVWKTFDLRKILSFTWQRNQGEGSKGDILNSGLQAGPGNPGNAGEGFSPFNDIITPGAANPSLVPCKPPPGWVVYVVKPTDSLFRLSLVFGVRIIDLQTVNCMTDNSIIHPGDTIFVPGQATVTPVRSPTPSPTATPRPYIPPPKTTRASKPQPTRLLPTATRPQDSTHLPPTATSRPTNTSAPPPTLPPPPTSTPAPTIPPTKPPTPTDPPPP